MRFTKIHKQFSLFSLYIAQAIPMSFFSSIVPVVMREEGYSLASIGLLQLIKLPWIIKLFWAPLIDDTTTNLRDYQRWILGSELFYAFTIACISFCSLQTDFKLIIGLMVIAFMASATQDIATDALAIKLLPKKERSFGASMQSMGSFVGTMVGAGVLLIIYHYFGWLVLLLGLAAFVLIAIIPIMVYRGELDATNEPISSDTQSRKKKRIHPIELLRFFKQDGISRHIIFLLLYYLGLISIISVLRSYMVDLSYTKVDIGLLFGIFGTATAATCSFIAGFLIRRFGKQLCRLIFAFLIIMASGNMFVISWNTPSQPILYASILFIWACYGMATVIVYNIAMDTVRKDREGTDFTLQTVLTHFSALLIAVLAGYLAQHWGYTVLFAFALLVSIASFLYNLFLNPPHEQAKSIQP